MGDSTRQCRRKFVNYDRDESCIDIAAPDGMLFWLKVRRLCGKLYDDQSDADVGRRFYALADGVLTIT